MKIERIQYNRNFIPEIVLYLLICTKISKDQLYSTFLISIDFNSPVRQVACLLLERNVSRIYVSRIRSEGKVAIGAACIQRLAFGWTVLIQLLHEQLRELVPSLVHQVVSLHFSSYFFLYTTLCTSLRRDLSQRPIIAAPEAAPNLLFSLYLKVSES